MTPFAEVDLEAEVSESADEPRTLKDIVARVVQESGVPALIIYSPRQKREEAWARAAIYYHAHRQGFSFPQIGQRLGRDHTSVLYGLRAHEKRLAAGMVTEYGRIIKANPAHDYQLTAGQDAVD